MMKISYGLAGIVIIHFKYLLYFILEFNLYTDNLKLKITCKDLFYLKSITYKTSVNKVP